MKIILMILLSACLSICNCEYPRFKRKGMVQNGPPRSPPPSQFSKKWGKPPQKIPPQYIQNRPFPGPQQSIRGNRPNKPPQFNKMQLVPGFNMHLSQHPHSMHNGPKFQKFPLQQQSKQPSQIKEYFKNPILHPQKNPNNIQPISGQIIQFPVENKTPPKAIHKHEKPSFVSSPSIPTAVDYDYHLQTNNIPLSINTIKQVGEKGPIHTIPAPNLTPADKPSNIEFRKPQNYYQQQEFRLQPPQYLNEQHQQIHHQYQVTEHNDQSSKQFYRDQINDPTHYNQAQLIPANNQQLDQHQNQQNVAQAYQNVQSVFYGPNGVTVQENGHRGVNIGFAQAQDEQPDGEDMLLSNSKLYQIVNDPYSTGQSNQNLYTQAIQSSYEQQQPKVLSQFGQSDPGYIQQYEQENIQAAEDKNLNVEPEYHSFNYDEQAHQAQAKSDQSSGLVSATYSLGTPEEKQQPNPNSRSSAIDPLTQTQIVQNYFDTRNGNDVEPDAKPSGAGNIAKEIPSGSFFSTLPNKEAAERLAKLQAAGKINSSLMKMSNKNQNQSGTGNKLSAIYVPEDEKDRDGKEQSVEYEDYSQEEESSQSDEESGFGQKTKF